MLSGLFHLAQGQNLDAIGGNGDRVFELRRQLAVFGHNLPAVLFG